MKNDNVKSKISIGSSSLILIFIIVCLAVFSLLSLSSANRSYILAQRNKESALEYYRADNLGEEFLKMTAEKMQELKKKYSTQEEYTKAVKESLGEYFDTEKTAVITEIPMKKDQALYIEIKPDLKNKNGYEIVKWHTLNKEDYEIDNSMPVWDGK